MVHYADAKLFGQGQANTNDFRVDWNCAVRMIGSAMSDKTPVGAVNLRLGGGDDDVKLNSDILHVTCWKGNFVFFKFCQLSPEGGPGNLWPLLDPCPNYISDNWERQHLTKTIYKERHETTSAILTMIHITCQSLVKNPFHCKWFLTKPSSQNSGLVIIKAGFNPCVRLIYWGTPFCHSKDVNDDMDWWLCSQTFLMIPTFPFSLSALCSPPRDMVCGACVGLLGPEAALRSFGALRAFSALGPLGPWGPWEAFGALAGTASLLDVQWLYPRLGSGESAHRQSRDTWCLVTRPSQTLEGNSTAIAVIITTRPMPRPGLASRLRHKSLPHPSIHL